MRLDFPLLKASDIECRIATVKQNGLSLLLYKDARVDQNILDDTVGPMNWQRDHKEIKGNLFCVVSIYDEDRGEWVSKSDCGVEPYTEKVKWESSDSFKRACFNWGIGRELYTAPFIWIPADACRIQAKQGRGSDGYTCYDSFRVAEIGYTDRRITKLAIVNEKDGRIVYALGGKPAAAVPPAKITGKQVNDLIFEMERTGITAKTLHVHYGIKDIKDMTEPQYKDAIAMFKRTPDRPNPDAVDRMAEEDGLPFN